MRVDLNPNKMSLEVFACLKKYMCKASCYVVTIILLILLFKAGNSYGQDQKPPPDTILPEKKLDFNEADFGFTTGRLVRPSSMILFLIMRFTNYESQNNNLLIYDQNKIIFQYNLDLSN